MAVRLSHTSAQCPHCANGREHIDPIQNASAFGVWSVGITPSPQWCLCLWRVYIVYTYIILATAEHWPEFRSMPWASLWDEPKTPKFSENSRKSWQLCGYIQCKLIKGCNIFALWSRWRVAKQHSKFLPFLSILPASRLFDYMNRYRMDWNKWLPAIKEPITIRAWSFEDFHHAGVFWNAKVCREAIFWIVSI